MPPLHPSPFIPTIGSQWDLQFTITDDPIHGSEISVKCLLCGGEGRVVLNVRGGHFTRTCPLCDGFGKFQVDYDSIGWFRHTDDLRVLRVPPAAHLPQIPSRHVLLAHNITKLTMIDGRIAEEILSIMSSNGSPPAPLPSRPSIGNAVPIGPLPLNIDMPYRPDLSHTFTFPVPSTDRVVEWLATPSPPPPSPTNQPSPPKRSEEVARMFLGAQQTPTHQTIVVLVNDGAKVLVWDKGDGGLTLPILTLTSTSSRSFAIERALQSITAHSGLVLEQLPKNAQCLADASVGGEVVAIRARVVGGTMPTVAAHEIPIVDWVEPSALIGSPAWPLHKTILTRFDLWEPPTIERMCAVVFGSWVSHPGHPTPPRSTVVDVAVGYFGKAPPSHDEMQAFGLKVGEEWGKRNISADVDFTVHVHHGLQKPVPDGSKVIRLEFNIPDRVTITPGHIGVKKSTHVTGGFLHLVESPYPHSHQTLVERVVPWAYGGQALSLSTLLFSATTVTELVNMWRYRPAPIILRLDDPGDADRLNSGQGFGISNLRNAIRHSKHLNVFDHAMNHVPWGDLVQKLATKDPNQEHMRWLWGIGEPTAALILFPEGVARVRRKKMFDDYAHRKETELYTMAQGFAVDGLADGGYGKEGLGLAFIREPIPYHTICREMFKKKG